MADKCILDPERDCIGSKRADYLNEQIIRELEEHKNRSHETHTQIFERLNKLETSSAELKTQYNAIMDKLPSRYYNSFHTHGCRYGYK